MKLFVVLCKTYSFGTMHYRLIVKAHDEEEARQTVYKHPKYHYDEDAEIVKVEEIDTGGDEPQVLLY